MKLRSFITTVILAACAAAVPAQAHAAHATSMRAIVPIPVSVHAHPHATFTLRAQARIHAGPGAAPVAEYLAAQLRPATGYRLPVSSRRGQISLTLGGADPAVGQEGYQLDITSRAVALRAQTAAGLFHGVQTLRQLFPPGIESTTVQPGPWRLPGGRIVDYPRFPYRGTMLDVARHFHPVATIKQHIDRIALYKVNHLHLHLSDDQGWRIVIDGWPRLATYGGSTQVGGGPGGYYTKAQYQEIVAYAASRHITIVPEIDMPGHTNAALASYAELNCDGVAPPLYTGIEVGFSALCTSREVVYRFIDDVLGEIAAMTPGPYLHIGGDEADTLSDEQYATFMNRAQPAVVSKGKTVAGWHQIAPVDHSPHRIVQFWGTRTSNAEVNEAVARGAKVVMSPANRAYLDMKYDPSTPLGLSWAGYIEVERAYDWDPGAYLSGLPEAAVLGVEAPLWTETIVTPEHIEYMAFPRLPAIAELGWSPRSTHDWPAFQQRLAAQGPRWTVMGIDYYRSPQIPWPNNRYEAENAGIFRGQVDANHRGFSGTGFVNYGNVRGSHVEWTIHAVTAQTVTLTFRYANGTRTDRPMDIAVNGHSSSSLSFPGTGSWSRWRTRTISVDLAAGLNTIRATATTRNGGPNVDCLEF